MEEESGAGSRRESSVGLSEGEDGGLVLREDLVLREGSNFEQQGAGGEKLTEPEGSVFQNPVESRDADVENTPLLTPERLKPEFVNSRESLVSDNEGKYLEENFLDRESTPDDAVNRQESIECRSFLESDDYSESAPTDNVSEMSTSVKNYSAMDDEGATPQFEDKQEILGKESEDVVMEIAERLSQLRSIGKTAESARKYILESDTSTEDLDSNDHMSDLLGPKRLDFEVIDFDQFGAQPPDLPLNDNLAKVNHHGGVSSFTGGRGMGASTKAKKPEHHVGVLDARNGFEREMKGLNDSPVKISLKNTPEKKHLRKERGAGAPNLPTGHVIPRLCNTMNVEESSRGQDVSRDLDTNSIAGRTGSSKLRLPDSMKPKKLLSDAPSGSPIRRSKSTMPDVKRSLVHEETRKRTEDLQHLTHSQAERLEDYCYRVDLSTAQLEEQSRMHEELNRKLETERGERLESEAKFMILYDMLPNVEGKLKNLCDQMLFMEVQLQEQIDLRNKLEEALERERQERMHLVAKLEEQVDLRNKLEGDLELERQERMHFAAKLEERVDLRNKLEEDLEQERQERLQLAATLDEQVNLRNKLEENLVQDRKERTQYASQLGEQIRLREELAYKLEQERDERVSSEAGLMVLREMFPNMEGKLDDLNNQVESLIGQLQEQAQLREELKEKLDQECKERMQHMTKMEDQTKTRDDLTHKFEEGRDERIINETNLKELRERLPKGEEKLKDLQDQVLLLASQLQQQIELRKELEERLDREREERIHHSVILANHTSESLPVSSIPWSEEKTEFTKLLDEQKELLANQVKKAEILKTATEKKVGLLNHQVQNLEMLSEIVETMESVFSAKERAIRQTMWTVFQAVCLGMGLMSFIVSCRNPLRSSLQPT